MKINPADIVGLILQYASTLYSFIPTQPPSIFLIGEVGGCVDIVYGVGDCQNALLYI